MAIKSKNKTSPTIKQPDLRPIDIYFNQYNQAHQDPTNKSIQFFTIPLLLFGVFSLLWAIPFPRLQFLGSYNGYINWASFLIAFAVYFYSRLSPMLSYLMLLVLLIFSYIITKLQVLQTAGMPLWLLCLVIVLLSLITQAVGNKMEAKKSSLKDSILFISISPIWLLHLILKKIRIKY